MIDCGSRGLHFANKGLSSQMLSLSPLLLHISRMTPVSVPALSLAAALRFYSIYLCLAGAPARLYKPGNRSFLTTPFLSPTLMVILKLRANTVIIIVIIAPQLSCGFVSVSDQGWVGSHCVPKSLLSSVCGV